MPTLGDIAAFLDLEVRGDTSTEITSLASLEDAGDGALSFVSKHTYLPQLATTSAAAVILKREWAREWRGPSLLCDAPYLGYARATALFDNRPAASGRIHPQAVVDPSAVLGSDVTVDAGAVIEAGAVLGDGVWIGANAYVGQDTHIGAGTRINPCAVIYYGVTIGRDCTIHASSVIGADGFGFAPSEAGWIKILQLGGVKLGDRVEIGACSTVDRGALRDTVVADNVILDDHVHIGHNVEVGERTGMAAFTGIGGSTRVGNNVTLAGAVGVADHIVIGDNVHVNGQGRVSKSLPENEIYASGTSIQPYREWSRNAIRFEQLAEMAKRLRSLEKQVEALKAEVSPPGEGESS